MQKNDKDFSMQEAMRLANSPAGQQLIALLQQSDPDAIRKAITLAASGDYTGVSQALSPLLEKGEVKDFMEKLGGVQNG